MSLNLRRCSNDSSWVAATLPECIALARREQLDYASFLEIILAGEISRRENRRIELRLQGAGFEETCRLEDFDWSASITLDRRLLDAVFSWAILPSGQDTRSVSSMPTTSSGNGPAQGRQLLGAHLPLLPVSKPAHLGRLGTAPFHRPAVCRSPRAHPQPARGVQLRHHQQSGCGRVAGPIRGPHPGQYRSRPVGQGHLSAHLIIEGKSYRERLSPQRAFLGGKGGD